MVTIRHFAVALLSIVSLCAAPKAVALKKALTAAELRAIAQQTTIAILKSGENGISEQINGSGALVARSGSTYFALTAQHTLKDSSVKYRVRTSDGLSYAVKIVEIDGMDVAVISFNSNKNYQLIEISGVCAIGTVDFCPSRILPNNPSKPSQEEKEQKWRTQLANGDYPGAKGPMTPAEVEKALENMRVFRIDKDQDQLPQILVAGFPSTTSRDLQPKLTLGSLLSRGAASALAQTPLSGGYELVYTNETAPGMSGGPIMDTYGRLIGLHGQGEENPYKISLGYSLGIPSDIFLNLLGKAWKAWKVDPRTVQIIKGNVLLPDLNGKLAKEDASVLLGEELSSCSSGTFNTKEKLIEVAQRFYRLQQYSEALICFQKADQMAPDSPEILYAQGVILSQFLGKVDEGINLLTRAIDRAKAADEYEFFSAWRWKGVALSKQQRYTQAVEAFEKAIGAYGFTNYVQAWLGKALALEKLGQLEQAIDAYRKASPMASLASNQSSNIARKTKDSALSIQRADALFFLGRYDAALQIYTQEIQRNDYNSDAWIGRIASLSRLGKYDQISPELAKARERNILTGFDNLPITSDFLLKAFSIETRKRMKDYEDCKKRMDAGEVNECEFRAPGYEKK